MLAVSIAVIAGGAAFAHADRVPADLWERLDRERF
jgi:hypothetical protein